MAELKRQAGGDLTVLGSGELVQSLCRRGLVVHSVVEAGRRLITLHGVRHSHATAQEDHRPLSIRC